MAAIKLYSDTVSNDTIVPNRFIEDYMPEATGEFVKVYLYLLRSIQNHSSEISISAIADSFNHTEKDILRAIKYWERQGIMRVEYAADKTIESICFMDICNTDSMDETTVSSSNNSRKPAAKTDEAKADEAKADEVKAIETKSSAIKADIPADKTMDKTIVNYDAEATATENMASVVLMAKAAKAEAKREFSLDEIKEFRKNPEITEMFFIIETYLKRTLSSSDINFVLYWIEELHFVPELVEYLVEYSISKGHSSLRYMDKVAISWAESNITTVEQAKDNAAIHSKAYYAVMKALGISGRNLAESESALVHKWSKEFGFDIDLIQEACKRTISATHQPSFEYTDSILSNWYNNSVRTLADVSKLDERFAKSRRLTVHTSEDSATTAKRSKGTRFNNHHNRDYDVDQFEKMLLTTSVQ